MKKKALIVLLVCLMGLGALSITNAEAGQWYTCTISKAGSTTWGYIMTVSDTATPTPAFTDILVQIDLSAGKGKEMYAAALTAWANSSNVWVYLENTVDYSVAYGVVAMK